MKKDNYDYECPFCGKITPEMTYTDLTCCCKKDCVTRKDPIDHNIDLDVYETRAYKNDQRQSQIRK